MQFGLRPRAQNRPRRRAGLKRIASDFAHPTKLRRAMEDTGFIEQIIQPVPMASEVRRVDVAWGSRCCDCRRRVCKIACEALEPRHNVRAILRTRCAGAPMRRRTISRVAAFAAARTQ